MKFEHPVRVVRASIPTKRILVVSDIHGGLKLFQELLEKLQYQPGEDSLVLLGDLVQKGTQNLDTVRFAMELSREKNVFILMGNNELFTLEGYDEELLQHASHFRERTVLGEMAMELGLPFPKTAAETHALRERAEQAFFQELNFLRGLPHVLETDKFLFAHAGLSDEELESQELEYVLAVPRFYEVVTHSFQKLLLVGHWPVANFRTDCLSNEPLYQEACNVLSIDGGNTLKSFGQLNGVILDNETGKWQSLSADPYPQIPAPCSQKAKPGVAVTWPENFVELLKRGESVSRCRAKKNGAILDVPNEFFYEDEKGLRVSDATNVQLELTKGEPVSLISEGKGWQLIMKNGKAGLLFPENGKAQDN